MTDQPLQAVFSASDPFDQEGIGQRDVIPPEGVSFPEPALHEDEALDPASASADPVWLTAAPPM